MSPRRLYPRRVAGRDGQMPASPHAREQRDFARSPLLVFFEVTQACDLVCLHCRACAQPRPDPHELSTAQARQLIDQLAEFPQKPVLILTGGDPLKRADIFELTRYATECGLEVSITPSATPLVTAEAIRQLKEAGIRRLAVSLDGADAATHDAFRGVAGSYVRTLEILRDAQAAGISTQVNTTLTLGNLGQIDQFAELLAQQQISMWSVFFLVPVGRAAAMERLSGRALEFAFAKLFRHSLHQPFAIKTTEAPHYRRFVIQHRRQRAVRNVPQMRSLYPTHGVNDGKGVLFVGHRGNIQPSGFLPLLCGVFPHDHIVDVYQNSPLLQALRDPDQLEGKCHRCEFRRICGGSRARAYAVSGSWLAEEPDCIYQPR